MMSRITSSTSSDQFGEVIEDKHKIAEGILAVNILSCSLPSYLEVSTQPVLEVSIGVKKKSADVCFKEGDETGTDTSKKIFHFQVGDIVLSTNKKATHLVGSCVFVVSSEDPIHGNYSL